MRLTLTALFAALAFAALLPAAQAADAQAARTYTLTLTRALPDGTRFGMPLFAYKSAAECEAAAQQMNAKRSTSDRSTYGCA